MSRGVHRRRRIIDLLQAPEIGANVTVTGWVKTARFSKNVSFAHIMDGSTPKTVQVVFKAELAESMKAELGVGSAFTVRIPRVQPARRKAILTAPVRSARDVFRRTSLPVG